MQCLNKATNFSSDITCNNTSISSEHFLATFTSRFHIVIANTHKLREEVYKIRYKVYCQELNYEREEDFPDGMEHDIYDQRSIHCLLKHRSTQLYAGCVRLILTDPYNEDATLPLEKVCRRQLQLDILPRYAFGEVSRLAVTAEFRKRQGETQTGPSLSAGASEFSEEERRFFPLIAPSLYLAATSLALEVGLDRVFALMEPRLARHLRRFGIKFQQTGDFVEFHGQRGIYQVVRDVVLTSMNSTSFDLFKSLQAQINEQLAYCCNNYHAA